MPGCSHNALSPGDKRPFDDYEYDAGESANGSSPEAPSPRVFQKTTAAQMALHGQGGSKQLETRRCSWSAQVGSINHGSDTSKSLGSLSESDPMSQLSHENVVRRPGVSTAFGACQDRGVEGLKSTDRGQHGAISPKSVKEKKVGYDSPATGENKRVPGFSGAERVAALTLLHLGVLGQQDIDRVREERRRRDGHSDVEMQACGQGNLEDCRAVASIAHVHGGVESDMDMSEGTADGFSEKRGAALAESVLRRSSRERKRRKGRSI